MLTIGSKGIPAAISCRISLNEQSRFSISGQRSSCVEYCDRMGWDIVYEAIDEGYTGSDFERPGWQAIRKLASKGKIRHIVALCVDRFSRNTPLAFQEVEWMAKRGVKIAFIMEGIILDLENPISFMTFNTSMMMAHNELIRLKYRIKKGRDEALRNGYAVQVAPFGYYNKPRAEKKERPEILVSEENAETVRGMFSLYLEGKGESHIYKWARSRGYKHTFKDAVIYTLTNVFYIGYVRVPAFDGKPATMAAGKHQAIIDEPTFWRVQQEIKNRSSKKTKPSETCEAYYLRPWLLCACCGNPMTSSTSRGKFYGPNKSQGGKYYSYYFCRHHKSRSYRAEDVHSDIERLVDQCSLSEAEIKYIESAARKIIEDSMESSQKERAALQRKIKQRKENISSLSERFAMKEDGVTFKLYEEFSMSWSAEIQEAEERMAQIDGISSSAMHSLAENIKSAANIGHFYRIADAEHKQAILSFLFPKRLEKAENGFRTQQIASIFKHKLASASGLDIYKKQHNIEDSAEKAVGSPDRDYLEPILNFLKLIKAA